MVDSSRYRALNIHNVHHGPVLYWMSRDQRIHGNEALALAQQEAIQNNVPFGVIFCLVPHFLESLPQHFSFMLSGLQEIEETLTQLHIPFFLLSGNPVDEVVSFTTSCHAGALITDMSPLTVGKQWRQGVANKLSISCREVDTHNIVPVWEASQKQEFSARTIRPKIHKLLHRYLTPSDPIIKQKISWPFQIPPIHWDRVHKDYANKSNISWIKPGERAAQAHIDSFIHSKLSHYDTSRNDPNAHGQSDLSPYLHFGHTSSTLILLEILKQKKMHLDDIINSTEQTSSLKAFVEELVVRKELSDNFCFYNPFYDSTKGFPEWAKKTLDAHAKDKRAYLYSYTQLEEASTHDEAWNASQLQLLKTGKMHGYMRMYWAKKILEWTPNSETALTYTIKLNDTYSLDGRDPNGYAGIAWSIGGVHDRPWFERPIFGNIRYMNSNGLRKKFNLDEYIHSWLG